ncbi:TM2 domain protein [Actinomyces sp. ICM54]|uniref:TM2 domain-containing protein n=1 Tax=Actinomyces sp. ICM54 TaxID=936549 RepID=UPI00045242FF|nr:TM2 domain-containing protein [Actinomyces sp. ICM54]EWC97022.1 TM2 domain protein [Actinomyces sp. ICM54]
MTTPDPQATPFQPEEAAEAPAFPQASTPGYDEATATPGSTTYGTAYDAQQGYGVPGPDANQQAAFAAGQQAYGQPAYGQPFAAGAPKQWIVAVLLAFFLGTLGIHNFYLGYTTKGIIQLVLTITVIGIFVSGPWALIDFIMLIMRSGSYATDAQGQPLQ